VALSKEVHVSRKPKKPKVSQKSSQSISQLTVNQPEVPVIPQLGWPVASSKKDQVSRKANQVESKPEVDTVSQPETSQSA